MADVPDTEGLNLVEMLDMLKPIPEPAPISMWPTTAAWLWLGLAVLAALLWAGWRILRSRQANAYRRAALAELQRAGDDPATIAAILRRTALAAFPRSEVASLSGPAWLAFLDRSYGGIGFSTELGAALTRAPWRPERVSPALSGLAREWIRKHRREAGG